MRHVGRVLWIALIVILLVQPALAQERKFAVRVGIVGMEPTNDSTVSPGVSAELESAFGGEAGFEWYFTKRLGLEASLGFLSDSDVESDDDMTEVTGISVFPVTVGFNGHLIRSERVDWYVGLVGGVIRYGNYDFEGGGGSSSSSSNKIDSSGVFGAQTAVDIAIGSKDRWGINLGVKYLASELEPDDPGLIKVDVDPLLYRAQAVFRF